MPKKQSSELAGAGRYDVFVSYSSSDKRAVRPIAELLREKDIRVWWDGWEMWAGDRLRNKINAGIQSSNYFLIILSPSSLNSAWVQNELDAAMIQEIEDRRVTVVPAILGKVDFKDLPADLRGKYSLDLRKPKQRQASVEHLVDLIRPERRNRRELLRRLRRPDRSDPSIVAELREHALRYGDQSIQIAALRGLEQIGTAEAVVVIVERALNSWGTQALEATTSSLLRMRGVGGGLALTAILLSDYRFFKQRAAAVAAILAGSDSEIANKVQSLVVDSSFDFRDDVPGVLSLLESASITDVSCGAVLARRHAQEFSQLFYRVQLGVWAQRIIEQPSAEAETIATCYAEERVPGLLAVLRKPRDPASAYFEPPPGRPPEPTL